MKYTDAKVTLRFVVDLLDRTEQNELIAAHFDRMYSEKTKSNFGVIADRMRECGHSWFFDVYRMQRVKDLQKINLCHNKFCINCAKMRALSRLFHFGPELDRIAEEYDLYHVILTVPNCFRHQLLPTIKKIFKSYFYLQRYFKPSDSGKSRIKGIDLLQYGYVGSLRSLEITYKGNEYHPHLHCIFAFKKGIEFDKHIVNRFSYSFGNFERKFSDMEVTIQKIWQLLNTDTKVNKHNIDSVDGYSCIVDKIEDGSYYEVFKYAMKVYDEKNNEINYEQFKTLYEALYNCRTIQGYGEFFRIQPTDEIDESFAQVFDVLVDQLRQQEEPLKSSNTSQDVFDDLCDTTPSWVYISRKSIYALDKQESLAAFMQEPSSQKSLEKALERLKIKKENSYAERQSRIAEEIRLRYSGRMYTNKHGERGVKEYTPKEIAVSHVLDEQLLQNKIVEIRSKRK